jgi:hypothetical protein
MKLYCSNMFVFLVRFGLIIAPVVKHLNFHQHLIVKLNSGKGFTDSTAECFRYFVTGAIIGVKLFKSLICNYNVRNYMVFEKVLAVLFQPARD